MPVASKQGIERVQDIRDKNNWSLQNLADRAQIHVDTLQRMVSGKSVARDTIRSIARTLGLELTDIVPPEEWSPRKVFISTYREAPDFDYAQELGSCLKDHGLRVSIATNSGADRLREYDYFVLLLSSQVAISEIVTEEVGKAKRLLNYKGSPTILSIHIGSAGLLNHDLQVHLEEIKQWEWRFGNPSTLATAVITLMAGDQPSECLVPTDLLPPGPDPDSSKQDKPYPNPEPPGGQVRIGSAFYVERPQIESTCYQEILQPGALIRIKAPRQMGKTSLMARILHYAGEYGCHTVPFSLQQVANQNFTSSDEFLKAFCTNIGEKQSLLDRFDECWNNIVDSNQKTTNYFEKHLLAQTASPLVIGLDEVDLIFQNREITNDFMGLLRVWYEKARYGDRSSEIWEKLRLVVVHSTEAYIPMDINQSPFNVGLAFDLPEFNQEQVQDLAQRHRLSCGTNQVQQLMDLVGGHPHLVRLALYQIACENLTLDQLLQEATTEAGPYSDHLRRHLWSLEQHPELAAALSRVVTANQPIELESELAFKLQSMGLVKMEGNHVQPSCNLYLQYFRERLRFTS